MTDGTVVPVRVMMVDDDPFILTVFAEQLDAQPSVSVCATAAGGGQALKTLSSRSHRIDVVLLDISMPDLDGIQTARAIHKQYPESLLSCSQHSAAMTCSPRPSQRA